MAAYPTENNLADLDTAILLHRHKIESFRHKISNKSNGDVHNENEQKINSFEFAQPSGNDCDAFLDNIIGRQCSIVSKFCSSLPNMGILNKRKDVVQEMLKSISLQHNKVSIERFTSKTSRTGSSENSTSNSESNRPDISSRGEDRTDSSSSPLLEISVKTGLSLFFSLLRQCWRESSTGLRMVCDDVLDTMTDVLSTLPPLSLASPAKLPKVGIESILLVERFLQSVIADSENTSQTGRQKCSIVLYCFAIQQGSLGKLLDWIMICLKASQADSSNMQLPGEAFWQMASTIRPSETGRQHFDTFDFVKEMQEIPFQLGGLLLLKELSDLSQYYVQRSASDENDEEMPSSDSTAFVWGSNSSHQLSTEMEAKLMLPKQNNELANALEIESGLYCTFVLTPQHTLYACGKSSHGRLGIGEQESEIALQKISFPDTKQICKVSSSKGSNGHTLALTADGLIYSWGDGDYGKLGHGNFITQKSPKLIQGHLKKKVVKYISAGNRHSAAVIESGEVFTWGEGEHGRLGLGDSETRAVPMRIPNLNKVMQVSCGGSHTLCLSEDGTTVWSFGAGDGGKLGHGDVNKIVTPKVISSLHGVQIVKVVASGQSSLAISADGLVYVWGSGPCLGAGSADSVFLAPQLLESLKNVYIVDISVGDSHCVALSRDNAVYSWGNNSMGQCGLGHCVTPVTTPHKVPQLNTFKIQQVSAGTSHSIVWTTPPRNRNLLILHRPYALSIETDIFNKIRMAIEFGITNKDTLSTIECHSNYNFYNEYLSCLFRLLDSHLGELHKLDNHADILGTETKPLLDLLFKLIHMPLSDDMHLEVASILSTNSDLLLPSLSERIELLYSLLPQRMENLQEMSKGQSLQLTVVLKSFQNHGLVADIFGCTKRLESINILRDHSREKHSEYMRMCSQQDELKMKLAAILLKLLFKTHCLFVDILYQSVLLETKVTTYQRLPMQSSLKNLLILMQNHLYACMCHGTAEKVSVCSSTFKLYVEMLLSYSKDLLVKALQFLRMSTSAEQEQTRHRCIIDYLEKTGVGEMLVITVDSLMLLSSSYSVDVMNHCLWLVSVIDKINRHSFGSVDSSTRHFAFGAVPDRSWFYDLQLAISNLIGKTLRCMMSDCTLSEDEKLCDNWLKSDLLENGLEGDRTQIESFMNEVIILQEKHSLNDVQTLELDNLPSAIHDNLNLKQTIEFASNQKIKHCEPFWNDVYDYALSQDVFTHEKDPPALMIITLKYIIAALAKQCCITIPADESIQWATMRILCDEAFTVYNQVKLLHVKGLSEHLLLSCQTIIYYCGVILYMIRAPVDSCTLVIRQRSNIVCQFLLDVLKTRMTLVHASKASSWNDSIHLTIINAMSHQNIRAMNKIQSLKILINQFGELSLGDDTSVPLDLQMRLGSFISDGQLFFLMGLFYSCNEGTVTKHNDAKIRDKALSRMLRSVIIDLEHSFWKAALFRAFSMQETGLKHSTLMLMKILTMSEVTLYFANSFCPNGNFPFPTHQYLTELTDLQFNDHHTKDATVDVRAMSNSLMPCLLKTILLTASKGMGFMQEESFENVMIYVKQMVIKIISKEDPQIDSNGLLNILVVVKRCCLTSSLIASHLGTIEMTENLSDIIESPVFSCDLRIVSTRLLAILLKESLSLQAEQKSQVIQRLLNAVWTILYNEPSNRDSIEYKSAEHSYTNKPKLIPVFFEPSMCDAKVTWAGRSVIRNSPFAKVAVVDYPIKSGKYAWKFLVVQKTKTKEGLCLGVSKLPIRDTDCVSTSDAWLYRCADGMLLHNGSTCSDLMPCDEGDYITCVLDMDENTLSFGVNSEDVKVAFTNINTIACYPCAMFYGDSTKIQVHVTHFRKLSTTCIPLTGWPRLSSFHFIIADEINTLLHNLHEWKAWTTCIEKGISMLLNKVTVDKQSSADESNDHLPWYCDILPAILFYSGIDSSLRLGSHVSYCGLRDASLIGICDAKGTEVIIQTNDSSGNQEKVSPSKLKVIPMYKPKLWFSESAIVKTVNTCSDILLRQWNSTDQLKDDSIKTHVWDSFSEFSCMNSLCQLLDSRILQKLLVDYYLKDSKQDETENWIRKLKILISHLVEFGACSSSLSRNTSVVDIQHFFSVLIDKVFADGVIVEKVKSEQQGSSIEDQSSINLKIERDGCTIRRRVNTGSSTGNQVTRQHVGVSGIREELQSLGFHGREIDKAMIAIRPPSESYSVAQYYSDVVDWLLVHLCSDANSSSDDSGEETGSSMNTLDRAHLFGGASAILQRFDWMADQIFDDSAATSTLDPATLNLHSLVSQQANIPIGSIKCELCLRNVEDLSSHMMTEHPGCGHHNNDHGYRSNGEYTSRLFRGRCGTGNTYYLLCAKCRCSHLEKMKPQDDKPMVDGCVLESAPDLLMDSVKRYSKNTKVHLLHVCSCAILIKINISLLYHYVDIEQKFMYNLPADDDNAHSNPPLKPVIASSYITKVSCFNETKVDCKTKLRTPLWQQTAALSSTASQRMAIKHVSNSFHCLLAKKTLLSLLPCLTETLPDNLLWKALEDLGLQSVDLVIDLLGAVVSDYVLMDSKTSANSVDIDNHIRSLLTIIKILLLFDQSELFDVISKQVDALSTHSHGHLSNPDMKFNPNPWEILKAKIVIQDLLTSDFFDNIHHNETRRRCLLIIADALAACIEEGETAHRCQEWGAMLMLTTLNKLKASTNSMAVSSNDLLVVAPKLDVKRYYQNKDELVISYAVGSIPNLFATSFSNGIVKLYQFTRQSDEMELFWKVVEEYPQGQLQFGTNSAHLAGVYENHVTLWLYSETPLEVPEKLVIDLPCSVSLICWAGISKDEPVPEPNDSILICTSDGKLVIAEINQRHHCYQLRDLPPLEFKNASSVTCAAWGCDDTHFALGHKDGSISFVCTNRDPSIETLKAHKGPVVSLEVMQWDCSLYASFGDDRIVKVYHSDSYQASLLYTFSLDEGLITCMSLLGFTSNTFYLAIGTDSGDVYSWKIVSKRSEDEDQEKAEYIISMEERSLNCESKKPVIAKRQQHCHGNMLCKIEDFFIHPCWEIDVVKTHQYVKCCVEKLRFQSGLGMIHHLIVINKDGLTQILSLEGLLLAWTSLPCESQMTEWVEDTGLVGIKTSDDESHVVHVAFIMDLWKIKSDKYLFHSVKTFLKMGISVYSLSEMMREFLKYHLMFELEKRYSVEKELISNGKALGISPYLHSLLSIATFFAIDQIIDDKESSPSLKCLKEFALVSNTANSLSARSPFPADFVKNTSEFVIASESSAMGHALDNNEWNSIMDTDIINWVSKQPCDWQKDQFSQVYAWGSGCSGQLAELGEGIQATPQHLISAGHASDVVCGQTCTFVLQYDGSLMACGDGSYGRLGLGNSDNTNTFLPVTALRGYVITQLATSHGSYGHSIALADTGEVFSWGDGEYGKLGHGTCERERSPRQVLALKHHNVIQVACGLKHSAIVTSKGEVFTFGMGEHGCLGHGDESHRKEPTQIAALKCHKIGQVSCGLNHTMVVSADGNMVWGFGSAEFGKLGDGGLRASNVPVLIKELQGIGIKSIGCGIQFTVALTFDGKIYTFGNDRYLGHPEPKSDLYPAIVDAFADITINAVSVGSEYTLALDSTGSVWTWGHNRKHQLGRDTNNSKLIPEMVVELVDKGIKNICAGRSHSAAWTGTPFPKQQSGRFSNMKYGCPKYIPAEYPSLKEKDMMSIKWRLKLLTTFSEMLYTSYAFINVRTSSSMIMNYKHFTFNGIHNGVLRPLLTNRMHLLPLSKAISTTMYSKQEASISVNRFGTGGHESPPSIYSQIAEQILPLNPQDLCRPLRAWKIRLVDEAADDAGGVFDDTVTEMCQELQRGDIGLFLPTENSKHGIGFNQDKFLLNPELRSDHSLGLFQFLGVLIGVSLRTRRPIDLPLASTTWKQLLDIPLSVNDLAEIDAHLVQSLDALCQMEDPDLQQSSFTEMFPVASLGSTTDSYQCLVDLTYENRQCYTKHIINWKLNQSRDQINAVRKGLSSIVPFDVLSLITPQRLEEFVCGSPDVDVNTLQKLTRYREITSSDDVIIWFWEILHTMSIRERSLFLRFVSGRSCLPKNLSDMAQRLQIVGCKGVCNSLPTAQTCFFVLRLPKYSSKAILSEKLSYAIHNCRAIDTDYYVLQAQENHLAI